MFSALLTPALLGCIAAQLIPPSLFQAWEGSTRLIVLIPNLEFSFLCILL
jgi:hypothetical protein